MLNCPVCGAQTPVNFRFTKLLACPHCKTMLFLEDEAVKHVGSKSSIVDAPSLFSLGRRYRYRDYILEAIGRIQFSYGRGYWDEWWMLTGTGSGRWVSVDEGDYAFESQIEIKSSLPGCDKLNIGERIQIENNKLRVSEINEASCIGIEGSLPEVIFPGEKHHYVECSGARGLLYTLECFEGQQELYKGSWIDPFDIKPY